MIHPAIEELVASVHEPGNPGQISPERLAERLGLDARQLVGDDLCTRRKTFEASCRSSRKLSRSSLICSW